MVRRFFSVRQMDLQQNHQFHPILLLSGPPSRGETSLLFQFAFNSAMEAAHQCTNGQVIFICNHRRLEAKPPYLSQGVDSSSESFQRIRMKYVDNEEGIKKYFAAFRLHDTFPVAVVIDDFGDFFHTRSCQERYGDPRGRDLAMVRTLALCHNAMIHAKRVTTVITITKQGLASLCYGYAPWRLPAVALHIQRWVSTIFTIQGDGFGSFIVKDHGNSGGRRSAKYSVALQNLLLEEITEASES